MTVAANLQEAAGLAYDNVSAKQALGTLKASLTAFWTAINIPGLFREEIPLDHPVANWIAIISDLTSNMFPVGVPPQVPTQDVNASAQFVYRLCLVANDLLINGQISIAQGAAIVASYNLNLG